MARVAASAQLLWQAASAQTHLLAGLLLLALPLRLEGPLLRVLSPWLPASGALRQAPA